jgi:short-subunit dehydrogenase
MNIIITGASSGIGAALAQLYAQEKHHLLLIGRSQERIEEINKKCNNLGGMSEYAIIDIRDYDKLKLIIEKFNKKHPVDLIIANAGISAGSYGGAESYEQLKAIFDTNIYGVVNSIYPLIADFKKRKTGQIAIISSMAALHALPSAPAYSCSKITVTYFGDSLRAELKKYNIKVNIIFPGYIDTPLTKNNNFPMPLIMKADIAAAKIKLGIEKNHYYIIFPKVIYFFLKIINLLPLKFTDFIFAKLPKK